MHHLGTGTRRRARAGITLIETVVAAAILAVAIAGLTNLSATSAALHQTGVEKEAAVRAAERELAEIVASDFPTIPAAWNNVGFTVGLEGHAGNALRAPPGDADGLPGNVQITAPTGQPDQLVDILVTVEWISPHGPETLARRMRLSRIGSGS
jgi:hypothetical protein